MLVEQTLFGVQDKVKTAIQRIQAFEPPEGYHVAFSGGKDSQTVYHLCKDAGVKFDAHYNLTTVDPPEVIYFMRRFYPDVIVDRAGTTMWDLIVKKGMPPTRMVRYCCDVFKESSGKGRIVVTGVRWAESVRRKNTRGLLELNAYTKHPVMLKNDNEETRRLFETCTMKSMHLLNPIIDWTEDDVWEYLNGKQIPHCCLYDEGFKRIGCIGCPLAGSKQMRLDFERYPKYREAYLRTFDRMLKAREGNGKPYMDWKSADDVMNWWLNDERKIPHDEAQMTFFEEYV